MKICRSCGSNYYGNENFCIKCGAALEEPADPDRPLCVTSLVFGILGFVMLLPVVGPLVSFFTGRAALKQGESVAASTGVALSVISLSFTALIAALCLLAFVF